MPKNIQNSVLTEDFLMDLIATCIRNPQVLSVFSEYIEDSYLPDRDFVAIAKVLRKYYEDDKKSPEQSIVLQKMSSNRSAHTLLEEICENSIVLDQKKVMEQLEEYIKQVKFQKVYKEIGDLYNKQMHNECYNALSEYTKWADSFSIVNDKFIDVAKTFEERFLENKEKNEKKGEVTPVTRFYIDELDELNKQRNLRGQLTCFLASTGVGKSHIARWIGKSATMEDGLYVLHIQLEGSEKEVVDAYSAALSGCNAYQYAIGNLDTDEITKMQEQLMESSGKLYVRAYPQFNCSISTVNVRNAILDFDKHFGRVPDITIIDSMDLLDDSSGKFVGDRGERFKRVKVAKDLKDLAADFNTWVIGTYQSTIENPELINDETFVLSEYNCSEAKGLARPVTHLISLNQSANEAREGTMRLYVAKSRFFKKGEVIKIANDYDHEQFYDKTRTMNLKTTDACTQLTKKRRGA